MSGIGVGWALATVLGVLLALRLAVRWLGWETPTDRSAALRILETRAIGTRRRLHVVEVCGERLLLASSESGLDLLRVLPERPSVEAAPDPLASSADPGARSTTDTLTEGPTVAPPSRRRSPAVPMRTGWKRLVAGGALGLLIASSILATAAETAHAADPAVANVGGVVLSLDAGDDPGAISASLELLALLTLVSVAPSILLMSTCFTRIVIVLAFVRQAMGVQHLPPNQVLVGLALFLTLFVMAPLGDKIRVDAYEPYVAGEIETSVAIDRAVGPVRGYLMQHTRTEDLGLFAELSQIASTPDGDPPLTSLLPAFVVSELRTAFEIGFMIFLPFLVIDLVIASMLISMGMIVLPPVVVSLPFKLMLFVLVDGWNLVLGSLIDGLT